MISAFRSGQSPFLPSSCTTALASSLNAATVPNHSSMARQQPAGLPHLLSVCPSVDLSVLHVLKPLGSQQQGL